jgi:hypothetical protein
VEIEGVDQTITTNYTIETSPTQRINLSNPTTALAGGELVRIKRRSAPNTNLVDFQNGSVLTESELDRAYLHNRYLAEEATEGVDAGLKELEGSTNYNAGNKQIKNLADGTLATDAVNKGYVDTQIALTDTNLAGFYKSTHTGNGADNVFTLSFTPQTTDAKAYIVSIDGLVQVPDTDYTIGATAITFNTIPSNSAEICVVATAAASVATINEAQVTATGSTTARSLANRFGDVVNVLDFGVVADGVTDNTAAYTAMINAVAEGSTIVFPKGSYKGDFISTKSFRLQGNGSTIIPVSNSAGCFNFQGSLGSYTSLSSAPAFGDVSLSGVTGLTGDTLLSLYSGNQRPSDNEAVNYETVLVKSDGSVIDKIYSDQNGGTPTYAVITPLSGIVIDGFHFEMGDVAMNGIFIRYAKDVRVSNISMNQGRQYTISIRNVYNVTVDHVRRYKPTDTGSGQGYNVGVLSSKYVKVDSVYGEGCRHDYDQDSTYVAEVNRVISVDAPGSSIVLAHTGFAGFTTVTNTTVRGNSYAIQTSSQGASSENDLLGRNFKIDGVNITNTVDMSSNNFYVGVYFQYPTEDLEIRNINITNANNPEAFDFAGGNSNNDYRVIRIYETRKNCLIENIKADSVGQILWSDQGSTISDSNTGAIVRNVSVKRFQYVVALNNGSGFSSMVLDNIKYYSSSSVYGASIFYHGGASNLEKLIIRGTKLSSTTDLVNIPNSGAPAYGNIETAGQTLRLSSLNALANGSTITQYDYLSRGELAIWGGSSSVTLNATTPIEKPVSRGNIFSIWNYHTTNILTIPANSNTVTNTTDITIAPGERAFFQPDSDGDKWLLMAVMTSGTMALDT